MNQSIDIGISEKSRIDIAGGLSRLFADTYTLYLMIGQLVKDQEAVVRTARSVFPVAEEVSDESTADLLTQRMQIHEKTAWMLRSMIS